ncbi:MAG: ice-binding family protein [Bacteroidota bacterium]
MNQLYNTKTLLCRLFAALLIIVFCSPHAQAQTLGKAGKYAVFSATNIVADANTLGIEYTVHRVATVGRYGSAGTVTGLSVPGNNDSDEDSVSAAVSAVGTFRTWVNTQTNHVGYYPSISNHEISFLSLSTGLNTFSDPLEDDGGIAKSAPPVNVGYTKLNDTLKFSGSASAVYIIKLTGDFEVKANAYVKLGNVKPENIYWVVSRDVSIANGAVFSGNVIAGRYIHGGKLRAGQTSLYADNNITFNPNIYGREIYFSKDSMATYRTASHAFPDFRNLKNYALLAADSLKSNIGLYMYGKAAAQYSSNNFLPAANLGDLSETASINALAHFDRLAPYDIYKPDNFNAANTDTVFAGAKTISPGYTYLGENVVLNNTFTFSGSATDQYVIEVGSKLTVWPAFNQAMGSAKTNNVVWRIRGDAVISGNNMTGVFMTSGHVLCSQPTGKLSLRAEGSINLTDAGSAEFVSSEVVYTASTVCNLLATNYTADFNVSGSSLMPTCLATNETPFNCYTCTTCTTSRGDNDYLLFPHSSTDAVTAERYFSAIINNYITPGSPGRTVLSYTVSGIQASKTYKFGISFLMTINISRTPTLRVTLNSGTAVTKPLSAVGRDAHGFTMFTCEYVPPGSGSVQLDVVITENLSTSLPFLGEFDFDDAYFFALPVPKMPAQYEDPSLHSYCGPYTAARTTTYTVIPTAGTDLANRYAVYTSSTGTDVAGPTSTSNTVYYTLSNALGLTEYYVGLAPGYYCGVEPVRYKIDRWYNNPVISQTLSTPLTTVYCVNETLMVQNTVSTNSPSDLDYYNFTWSLSPAYASLTPCSTSSGVNKFYCFKPTATGACTVSVHAQSKTGSCSNDKNFIFNVLPNVMDVQTITPTTHYYCYGTSAQLSYQVSPYSAINRYAIYTTATGNVQVPCSTAGAYLYYDLPTAVGTYNYYVGLAPGYSCTTTNRYPIGTIVIRPNITPEFTMPAIIYCVPTTFKVESPTFSSYPEMPSDYTVSWLISPGTGLTRLTSGVSFSLNNSFIWLQATAGGDYNVTLRVIDNLAHCTTSVTHAVHVEPVINFTLDCPSATVCANVDLVLPKFSAEGIEIVWTGVGVTGGLNGDPYVFKYSTASTRTLTARPLGVCSASYSAVKTVKVEDCITCNYNPSSYNWGLALEDYDQENPLLTPMSLEAWLASHGNSSTGWNAFQRVDANTIALASGVYHTYNSFTFTRDINMTDVTILVGSYGGTQPGARNPLPNDGLSDCSVIDGPNLILDNCTLTISNSVTFQSACKVMWGGILGSANFGSPQSRLVVAGGNLTLAGSYYGIGYPKEIAGVPHQSIDLNISATGLNFDRCYRGIWVDQPHNSANPYIYSVNMDGLLQYESNVWESAFVPMNKTTPTYAEYFLHCEPTGSNAPNFGIEGCSADNVLSAIEVVGNAQITTRGNSLYAVNSAINIQGPGTTGTTLHWQSIGNETFVGMDAVKVSAAKCSLNYDGIGRTAMIGEQTALHISNSAKVYTNQCNMYATGEYPIIGNGIRLTGGNTIGYFDDNVIEATSTGISSSQGRLTALNNLIIAHNGIYKYACTPDDQLISDNVIWAESNCIDLVNGSTDWIQNNIFHIGKNGVRVANNGAVSQTLKLNCNTFVPESDLLINPLYPEQYGVYIYGSNTEMEDIGGTGVTLLVEKPSGNIWPSDRSGSSWISPDDWESIHTESGRDIYYYQYDNEFIGTVNPEGSGGITKQQTGKNCGTQYNINQACSGLTGSAKAECELSYASNPSYWHIMTGTSFVPVCVDPEDLDIHFIGRIAAKDDSSDNVTQVNSGGREIFIGECVPNPASEEAVLNYELKNHLSGAEAAIIEIATGRQIMTIKLLSEKGSCKVPLTEFSSGVYNIRIRNAGIEIANRRLVVIK